MKKTHNPRFVQYGCGLDAPKSWINYDASPTLRIQKIFLLGRFLRPWLNVCFPDHVKYGNIIKGLPELPNSCDGIYCSHVLEHLSLGDLRMALKNTYKLLKPEGIFRLVVPDLEFLASEYLQKVKNGNAQAAVEFVQSLMMGRERRKTHLLGFLSEYLGNSHHMWMWDEASLKYELQNAGFRQIRRCQYGDAPLQEFHEVERESRFINCLALESRK